MLKLPIDSYTPQILNAIKANPVTIIKAEPGAGKTTRIPLALLQDKASTIVLEPRRLAAKLSAEHVAELHGSTIGEDVGYQIRFDQKIGPRTKLRFMTEGLFLRLLESNPTLQGFTHIVLDEFHERHLDTDVALAFIRHLQENQRPDLKLLIMSATVDLSTLDNYLPESNSFEVPGRVYPVEIVYKPGAAKESTEQKVIAAVQDMIQRREYPGHILVFLSGRRPIQAAQAALQRVLAKQDFDVLPLMADLPPKQQKKAFQETGKRKIILATNVAETSLTIDGITGVIDTGLANISSYAPWSGLPMLQEAAVSQASCIQRTGRAGRTQQGICYRLFDENDFLKRDRFTPHEMSQSELSQLILFLKSRLAADADPATCLPWLSPPPEKHLESSSETLKRLSAIDQYGALTTKGQAISQIPLHPRLGAIILEGQSLQVFEEAILASCLISEGMILQRGSRAFEEGFCDLSFQSNTLLKWVKKQDLESIQLTHAIDSRKVDRVTRLYRSLQNNLGARPLESIKRINHRTLSQAVLAGFPDRVAKYRPAAKNKRNPSLRHFHFCLGRGGVLADSSVARKGEFLIVLDAHETPGRQHAAIKTQIRTASSVSLEQLFQVSPMLSTQVDVSMDDKSQKVLAFNRVYYGQFVIKEESREAEPDQITQILTETTLKNWPFPFDHDDDLKTYHRKLELMRDAGVEHSLPVFEGEMLELLIHAICEGQTRAEEIRQTSLRNFIYQQLSYEDQMLLDLNCPDKIELNGRQRTITYLGEHSPAISSRIQDFFGLQEGPKICGGRWPLTLVMLAPNQRPAQTTKDLAGFWSGSYAIVRKELARRYPKHQWPENPLEG
ncbi:ATP-dependent helicase HrpB [Pseudobacteriovorax antillogorgiicola]|uniref:ATP-dependent helicase HrpB n=1 Tax=Pseudobacteriovorax antillogorgiicola TaxID=1513793 RepID=A0A1Y6CB78_9BACT|nr:ATP-dependent helicase HrpB [Pseudobacteriovorax antillogorgiicola]TCS49436.1 ATP-dependent helicase HrpB [Pseudobacteriovorax antillogorgiicola]SMF46619.1 ATP-dependent helicase HrpB [Pseudobacteriovorax antillogorgiicola]